MPSNIIVNHCQKGNRLLNHIKNVGWEFGNIIPDYAIGDICALYLSLKYHLLHPDYIYQRTKLLKGYKLRLLLCLVDIEHNQHSLEELAKLALAADLTLLLAWSNQEAARYLETYKVYENKGPEMIKDRPKTDFMGQITETLTSVRGVNKTDVQVLLENFGSLKNIVNAPIEDLLLCPGLGQKKVLRLHQTFHQPFKSQIKQNNNTNSNNNGNINNNTNTDNLVNSASKHSDNIDKAQADTVDSVSNQPDTADYDFHLDA